MNSNRGYVMSTRQLNELWHYDLLLAHLLLDLPLRKCLALPKDLPIGFPPMKQEEFNILRRHIASMWVQASLLFRCEKGDFGWGLFAGKDFEKNSHMFTASKTLVMGWVVRVPTPEECPTGHRYLRSPAGKDECPYYLGGPASLANFDPVNRVVFKRCLSGHEPLLNKVYISKERGRKIVAGQEILWSYSLDSQGRKKINFYTEEEWFLDVCCSQGTEICAVSSIPPASAQSDEPISKRRKVGGQRPLMSQGEVATHKPCTYCGKNLSADLAAGKKLNIKRHLALKHAAQLCSEMGKVIDCEVDAVCDKDFIKHLDKVDHIYNSLKSHGYKVVPACNYFEFTNTAMLPLEASPEEKEALFHEFYTEARTAFYRYQVVHLKGIMIPEKYEDLLKMNDDSNYCAVNWATDRPSGINFSLCRYNLTPEEDSEHTLDIKSHLTSLVVGWV